MSGILELKKHKRKKKGAKVHVVSSCREVVVWNVHLVPDIVNNVMTS